MPYFIDITDFEDPALDLYARLTENQLLNRADPDNAVFIAESPLVIERALDAGCVPVSVLTERKLIEGRGKELLERCGDVPVYAAELPVRRVAVLENVMNPTNLGAIFRSAAALGVDAVLLTSAGSDPLYRRAVRVSMGTVFQVPWSYLPAGDWQALLRAHGFKTAAMALRDDSLSISDARLPGIEKLAVVLGTEGDGLAASTIAACDYTVRIPMSHGVDSLNVAAASAVAFYALCLTKEQGKTPG